MVIRKGSRLPDWVRLITSAKLAISRFCILKYLIEALNKQA